MKWPVLILSLQTAVHCSSIREERERKRERESPPLERRNRKSRKSAWPLDWEEIVESAPTDEIAEFFIDWSDYSVSPRLGSNVVKQIKQDLNNASFAPDLRAESRSESTPIGPLSLDTRNIISATDQSTIHAVDSRPDIIVKYQTDCLQSDKSIHAILLDFWFLEKVKDFGFSPKPLAVSPPSPNPPSTTFKCSFRMDDTLWPYCEAESAVVRYSVMERVGQSLHSAIERSTNKRIDFKTSIGIAIQLIQILKVLHLEALIVHADIHSGNICFSLGEPEKIRLIDYGMAFFIDDHPDDERVRPDRSWNHALFSPWEIQGFHQGPRDDVYKALLCVAILMNGNGFYRYLTSLEDDVEASMTLKQESNIFLAFHAFSPLDGIGLGLRGKQKIAGILLDVLTSVPSLHSVRDHPDYDSIIHQFESILKVF